MSTKVEETIFLLKKANPRLFKLMMIIFELINEKRGSFLDSLLRESTSGLFK